MKTFNYKGYIGSILFSSEDNVFWGKIELIEALVTFEGNSITELKQNFKNAVNDYLMICKEEGVQQQPSEADTKL